MTPRSRRIILSGLLAFSASVHASLPEDINNYFRKIHPKPLQLSVEIKTPIERWPACEKPVLQMPAGGRNTGNVSLPVLCGKKRTYIQLSVNVTGQYFVATRQILRGETIQLVDVGTKRGLLHKLPAGTVTSRIDLRGSIALRNISAGQTYVSSMTRKPWAIKAGQSVYVVAGGDSFSVKYEGRAINNAATGSTIRVRLVNGQVVSGEALENGSVKVSL